MPVTYDYKCRNPECGNTFEHWHRCPQAEAVEKAVDCPECGSETDRLASIGGGVHFKGSGFHCTDYPKPADENSVDYIRKANGKMVPNRKKNHPDGYRWHD